MENKPKILDHIRAKIRLKHYSRRTGKTYISWIKRFILFHDKKHPKDMGKSEIEKFLTYLVTKEDVAASTQNQAISAILFLYTNVLDILMGGGNYDKQEPRSPNAFLLCLQKKK